MGSIKTWRDLARQGNKVIQLLLVQDGLQDLAHEALDGPLLLYAERLQLGVRNRTSTDQVEFSAKLALKDIVSASKAH